MHTHFYFFIFLFFYIFLRLVQLILYGLKLVTSSEQYQVACLHDSARLLQKQTNCKSKIHCYSSMKYKATEKNEGTYLMHGDEVEDDGNGVLWSMLLFFFSGFRVLILRFFLPRPLSLLRCCC